MREFVNNYMDSMEEGDSFDLFLRIGGCLVAALVGVLLIAFALVLVFGDGCSSGRHLVYEPNGFTTSGEQVWVSRCVADQGR